MPVRKAGVLAIVAAIAVAVSTLGCGSAPAAQTSPTHTPSPQTVTGPFVELAGTWTGTIESSNFPARTITVTLIQSLNCVDGVWRSNDGEWTGAISGLATMDAYTGQVSFERSEDRGRCGGIANVAGPSDPSTLRWSGAGFAVRGTCAGDLPQSIVLSLVRQR
ncbi:MAG: hypothetical protein ABL986_17115 [Vicinamibacterales bacterium]